MQRLASNEYTDDDGRARDPKLDLEPTATETSITPLNSDSSGSYRVYKRRFLGLAQLILLNIISSWDWITFAPISTTAGRYFGVSQTAINWLSIACLLVWIPAAPFVIWTLNKGGPKTSLVVSSTFVLLGNWVRYGGTAANPPRFGVVMFGQILVGISQPFVLAAPTRYSNLWFSDKGRVSATAVASLANPFGAAIGELIGPIWAPTADKVPQMVLYTAIMSSIICLPAPFIPKEPPTPPSAIAASERLDLRPAFRSLPKNISFWLILVPFSVYVGGFNATSSVINQILYPYGFSETDAGIAGALMIFVGLATAAIVSPFVDRSKRYTETMKTLAPIIAIAYLALIFMPQTRTVAGPYIICAVLGASSFSLLPCTLEYLVLVTHPVSPEITSTICWTTGQLIGAIFIIVMSALRGGEVWGAPKKSMVRALVFQAVIAWVAMPCVYWLGTERVKRNALRLGAVRG